MQKRNLYIIIFIISVVGLVVIQYQYLRIGLNLANVRFNQNIGKFVKSIQSDLSTDNQLTFLLGKAITNDDTYFNTGLDSIKTSSNYFLNDFLEFKLLENGVKKGFSYNLYVKDTTLQMVSKNFNEYKKDFIEYSIKIDGYLPNLVKKDVVLEMRFNRIHNYFLSQLNRLTIPSFLFLAAIIIVVIWVLKSFYWQQSVITRTNDFINNLTHELKTPVFSIGLATKMLQSKINEEDKTYLEIIKNQNNRLKDHIDKVLQLASLDKDNRVLNLKRTNINQQLNQLCEEFKIIAAMEQVDFNYKISNEQFFLKCDALHFINAINNLLDNAKKYSIENPKIELTAKLLNKKLIISVVDNGLGIDKKHQKKIFKKHFRVTGGDLYTVKGYGLGLSYVKKIVKLHKGKIEIKSEINKGTTIKIIVPTIS